MEQDDPEKRIADLERGLAESPGADVPDAFTTGDRLTPQLVHNVAFSKAPLFKRGYREDEVDAFLDRVETTLRDPTASGALTPVDLHGVTFSKPQLGARGYNEDEVDAFVELVKIELSRR